MSFSARKKDVDPTQQFVDQAPKVQATNTANITTALTETNRILVEIQKQLALDFANRIAEKKQNLYVTKKNIRKQNLVKKEAFVEKGKDIGRGKIGELTSRVIAPVKGIFDKLIEFFTLVGAGIVINNAWKWLQDPENRKKLADVFAFLKTYWKEIIAGIVLTKLIGAATSLIGFANTLRKIFNRLRGLNRRPPQSPPSGGSKPIGGPGGDGCGPVTGKGGCLDQLSATSSVANKLAQTLFATAFATNYFNKFALKTVTTPVQAPKPVEAEAEAEAPRVSPASYGPLISEGIKKAISEDRSQSIEMPDGGRVFIDRRGRVKSVKTGEEVKQGEEESKFYLNMFTGLNLPAIAKIMFGLSRGGIGTRTTLGTNVLPGAPQIGTFPGFRSPGYGLQSGAFFNANEPVQPKPTVKVETPVMPGQKVARPVQSGAKNTKRKSKLSDADRLWKNQIDARAKEIMNDPKIYNKQDRAGTQQRLIDMYSNDNGLLVDRAAARTILIKKSRNGGFDLPEKEIPKVAEGFNPVEGIFSKLQRGEALTNLDKSILKSSGYTGSFSKGGTVFGQGSQTTDSVPAMLAPGEEVIRASAANLFRPLLKDINDNAGRMWSALSNAIGMQKKNTERQERVSEEFNELTNKFNKHLESLIQQKRAENLKKFENSNEGGGIKRKKPQTHSKPKRMNVGGGFVKTQKRSVPKQIQTYRRGRGGGPGAGTKSSSSEGKITTINMTQPALTMAGQQTPEPPTQSSQSASPSITIRPFDKSNEYIMNNYMLYGINT